MRTYTYKIKPISDDKLWLDSGRPKPFPPPFHKRPRRPKKVRRKAADEEPNGGSRRRHYSKLICDWCLELGHNSKRYNNQFVMLPSRGGERGRPPSGRPPRRRATAFDGRDN